MGNFNDKSQIQRQIWARHLNEANKKINEAEIRARGETRENNERLQKLERTYRGGINAVSVLIAFGMFVLACLGARSIGRAFLIGLFTLIVWEIVKLIIRAGGKSNTEAMNQKINEDLEAEKKRLTEQAEAEAMDEIGIYKANTQAAAKKIYAGRDGIKSVVDFLKRNFREAVSGACSDAANYEPIVKGHMTFMVTTQMVEASGAYYTAQFVFKKERFHDLTRDYECEGMAEALYRLLKENVAKSVPAAQGLKLTMDHVDAKVTVGFELANKNFVPASNIL